MTNTFRTAIEPSIVPQPTGDPAATPSMWADASEDDTVTAGKWTHSAAIASRMASTPGSDGLARRVRRSVAWYRFKEYVNGALWVLPSGAAVVALAAGYLMSQVTLAPGSVADRLAFQGTADDARTVLITVSSTVVTVIALVLGLTVVALQLSSTQFSPRLLRNFLRDRATQVVLSAFIATFVYSAAGLFTVGLAAGTRTEDFPRLAISGSILLLFVSLGFVVYFADHLAHSIQIDAIHRRIERNTRRTISQLESAPVEEVPPRAPDWAVPLVGRESGYIQTVHPELLLRLVLKPTSPSACGMEWGITSSPGRCSAGSGRRRRTTHDRTASSSRPRSFRTSGWVSSAPSSRTSGSASGSRPTSPARLYRRPSTTPTPPFRPPSTSPSCTATSPSGRSAPRSSTTRPAVTEWSCPAARSRTTSGSSATSWAVTAPATSR
jgi:Predicted membrane protein (DUF2254)